MTKNLVITISGGRSSAMMARHIQTHPKYDDFQKAYIFANTGMERPETIEFLRNCEKHWGIEIIKVEGTYSAEQGIGIGYKIVGWDELDMDANPFAGAIMQKNKGKFNSLPNSSAPYCSDSLKTVPLRKCANDIFGNKNYQIAVGMRWEDTPHRISMAEARISEASIYPLLLDFDTPINLSLLDKFWQTQPFKLTIPSYLGNCELCWKKSNKSLAKIVKEGSKFVKWWQDMEKNYDSSSFRGKKSIEFYIKLAQMPVEEEINFDTTSDSCVCNLNDSYEEE